MGPIRKFGTALAIAGAMAAFTGTSLEAKKKPGGGGGGTDPNAAVCAYLESIMTYQYTSPYILAYVSTLWETYRCGN
jgi:hypothetical protein